MKKFFTLIAAVAMAASMNAQTLSFDKDYDAGYVPAIFSTNGLVLTVVDTNNKLVVEPNSAYFGTADSYQPVGGIKYGIRWVMLQIGSCCNNQLIINAI